MLVCDRVSFQYLAANRAATLLYGYTEEQMLGLTPFDIRPEGDRAEFRAWFSIHAVDAEARRCSRHRRNNGSLVYVTTISRPMIWESRRAYIFSVVDVAESMDETAVILMNRRNWLERDLEAAVAKNQLRLMYQPVVCARTRKILGIEALLRWQHPELGLLQPADFIDVAEASGQIVEIGAWVLREACQKAKDWQAIAPGLQISVNVSARQFVNISLPHYVKSALSATRLDPALLFLEITETAALTAMEEAAEILSILRQIGVKVLLDDFGTGYNALGNLKMLSVDGVKIDRLFISGIVADQMDRFIAEAVIDVAHKFGLHVVAEGIEAEDQAQLLQRLGADSLQGFLFSKPADVEQIERLLRNDRSHHCH